MKRGNEQSAKKASKVLYVAKNACMSRITSLNDQNQSTRVEINVLSSYLSAEKLSIPRVNEYEKGRSFFLFFFRRLKKNMKVEEDIQWRFPRVTSARKPFVYRELCQSIEESKKRETRKGWLDMLSKLCELFQVLVFVENLDVERKGF